MNNHKTIAIILIVILIQGVFCTNGENKRKNEESGKEERKGNVQE
jgi:hypothetical protein